MQMFDKWFDFWQRIEAGGDPMEYFTVLNDCYNDPKRFHHNFWHILECLFEFEEARNLAQNPNEVEAAIWFHDLIYNPRSDHNEEMSAGIASALLSMMGMPAFFIRRADNLIRLTKHLDPPGDEDIDGKLIVDIDLASLGKPYDEFKRNTEKIRKEFSFVPEDKFRQREAVILKRFLDRQRIYLTDYFYAKYETQARENLNRSINELEGK